jgi:hypothetical protein
MQCMLVKHSLTTVVVLSIQQSAADLCAGPLTFQLQRLLSQPLRLLCRQLLLLFQHLVQAAHIALSHVAQLAPHIWRASLRVQQWVTQAALSFGLQLTCNVVAPA